MRLEDLDFDALINQFWGSEANLEAFLNSETPRLCSRICGPGALVPKAKLTYPPLKGEVKEGEPLETAFATRYRRAAEGNPATIQIPALIAGNRAKLPEFIALGLIHHREALGLGDPLFDYPEPAQSLLQDLPPGLSGEVFKELYSPRFVAKAIEVARDFEISLLEFLFPRISLSIYR